METIMVEYSFLHFFTCSKVEECRNEDEDISLDHLPSFFQGFRILSTYLADSATVAEKDTTLNFPYQNLPCTLFYFSTGINEDSYILVLSSIFTFKFSAGMAAFNERMLPLL